MKLTKEQIESLEKLWFIFGNKGSKSTLFNHKYIQGFLEANEDRKKPYLEGVKRLKEIGLGYEAITQECICEVEKIIYEINH
jgi:hypothetical protein